MASIHLSKHQIIFRSETIIGIGNHFKKADFAETLFSDFFFIFCNDFCNLTWQCSQMTKRGSFQVTLRRLHFDFSNGFLSDCKV